MFSSILIVALLIPSSAFAAVVPAQTFAAPYKGHTIVSNGAPIVYGSPNLTVAVPAYFKLSTGSGGFLGSAYENSSQLSGLWGSYNRTELSFIGDLNIDLRIPYDNISGPRKVTMISLGVRYDISATASIISGVCPFDSKTHHGNKCSLAAGAGFEISPGYVRPLSGPILSHGYCATNCSLSVGGYNVTSNTSKHGFSYSTTLPTGFQTVNRTSTATLDYKLGKPIRASGKIEVTFDITMSLGLDMTWITGGEGLLNASASASLNVDRGGAGFWVTSVVLS